MESEEVVCSVCIQSLPYTNQSVQQNNIADKLRAIEPIDGVFTLTYLNKGNIIEELIHQLKYRGRKDVGERLGELMAASNEMPCFDYDLIIPIPLHLKKENQRGYNQALAIAKGVSKVKSIPLIGSGQFIRVVNTSSQTKKNREERYQSMENVFLVIDEQVVKDQSIILVDDVMTTGATTLSAARELFEKGAKRVLIATVALANPF